MSLHACVVTLLSVLSRAVATKSPEWWSGEGAAPIKILSINAELDMDQQTADVRVRGPRGMQAARDDHECKACLDNTQTLGEPRREVMVAAEPLREADPSVAGPAKPQLVVTAKAACCQACEAPYAVHILHALAHGLGMLVVLCMWVLLTAVIFRFC